MIKKFIFTFVLCTGLIAGSLYPMPKRALAQTETVVAFPGAEGFGAQSVGGRGGNVIEVTNLNDSGQGSFRACVTAQGPRTCVFRVGGTITTESKIVVTNPYLTIAGQTAPGGGITIRAAQSYYEEPLIISTHNVIIRFVRFRAGASAIPNSSRRSLTINNGAYNVIIDHCSFSWATDQPLLLSDGAHDITIQWSIISEALAHSTHFEGGVFREHSTGLSVSGKNYNSTAQTGNITIHHNLLAHNGGRNPQNAGFGLEDVVNNVIYNWGGQGFTTQDLHANVPSNIVNNYFQPGPNTSSYEIKASHVNPLMTGPQIYVSGNLGPHRTTDTQPNSNIVGNDSRIFMVTGRFPAPAVTTTSAVRAYQDVLAKAGTRLPMLDAVDKRILEEAKRGEGRIIDCVSANELRAPINCATRVHLTLTDYNKYRIYDPIDQTGWPVLAVGTPTQDSDHDGMPDSWEADHGLNPNVFDGEQDQNGNGYTNIEEYLDDLASPPGATTLILPSGSLNTKFPTYTWQRVFAATRYHLWVNAPSGNGYIKQWYEASAVCSSNTCSVTPAVPLSSGTYTWWIRASNFAGDAPWSRDMSFSLPDPPGAATVISPSENIIDTTPTYTWNKVNDATWYYLWVNAPSSNGYIKQWYEASAVCDNNTCAVTPDVELGTGIHTWWIRTWNVGDYGPWSDGMSFSPPGPPGAATLISPSENLSNPTPIYTWNKISDASWYYLWVSKVNADGSLTTVHSKWYDASTVCSDATCSFMPEVTLSAGEYRWWIQTWNDVGYGPWSSFESFTISP